MSSPPPLPPSSLPFANVAGPSAAAPTIGPEHLAILAQARDLHRPIRRAAGYATFESATLALFGVLTLVSSISPPISWAAVFVGLMLCATGTAGYIGAKRLRALDPSAPKLLALNQIVLGCSLAAYAVFRLLDIARNGAVPPQLANELAAAGVDSTDVEDLARMALSLVYYTLIAVAVFGQGATALFYWSRRKRVERYLTEVPEWARTLTR